MGRIVNVYSASGVHPELRLARLLPRSIVSPRSLGLMRGLTRLVYGGCRTSVVIEYVNAHVSVRAFTSPQPGQRVPGVLYIHGGGYVMGCAAMGDGFCRRATEELGACAASVMYRLAPEHPFPAALLDCHAALLWLARQPYVDRGRIGDRRGKRGWGPGRRARAAGW